MCFVVVLRVLLFSSAKGCNVLLKVSLCQKEAGTVGAFDEAFAVLFSHFVRLVDVYEYFFAVKF
jgi:hypothetical protein